MGIREQWAQRFRNTRTRDRVQNNLGIVHAPGTVRRYRVDWLNELDKYYDGTQYDDLIDWDLANESKEYLPVRQRKPRVRFRLAKRMADEIGSKLFGEKVAPQFGVEDDPDTTYFLGLVEKASRFRLKMMAATIKACTSGSCFARFYFAEGHPVIEIYASKWCYPVFSVSGELQEITVRWVWTDTMELDNTGKPREKWGQLYLSKDRDVLFDTPAVESGADPVFNEVGAIDHGLGFVQGEWFRTTDELGVPDGQSIIEPAISFFSEMDYSASQSSQAISYNQEPIPLISGLDVDSIDELIKSSTRGWNLGREGDAKFLESNLAAVQRAMEFRDKIRLGLQDVTRILLMDPEKMVGHAQSGKSLEVLHGPLLDVVYMLRESFGPTLSRMMSKMATVAYMLGRANAGIITVPPGWSPASLDPTVTWPDVFPETVEDLQKKVSVGVAAANASIVSRETITRWLAKSFGIEDVEAEVAKVAAQPILNPFGSF
jgi:hypothetical protein